MPKSSGDPGPTTAATRRRSSPPKVRFTVAPSLFHYEIGNPVDGGGTTGVVEALNKRQPPSCDNCRTRKLRCSGRPELIELGAEATATVPCDHCREWNLDCSYRYNRKRRGRRNRVVERLADEQRARKQSLGDTRQATGSESESEDDGPGGSMSGLEQGNGIAGSQDLAFDTLGPAEVRDSGFDFQIGNPQPSGSSQWTRPPVSRSYPPQQPAQGPPMSGGSYGRSYDSSQSRQDRLSFQASPNSANSFPPLGSLPGSVIHPRSGGTYVSVSPQTNGVSPSMALSEASVPATTSIESMLNRDLAMHIIDLYFAHVYCIIPVIHRPSFMADLANHEEEKRPVFFALIMAMIAMTLIHIPRTFFPTLPPEGVRKLSDHCLKAVYAITRREMDLITVDLICIKYFAIVIHNKHGNVGLESSAFGEALHLSITLGLHREDMYADLNPIEAERRRRAWFLIYNADKFEAASRAKPVLLRSDEFMGAEATELPAEIDDKSITIHAYLPSSSPVPLICGFNILTRIVSILGDLLVHERDIRRRPPTEPEALLVALREVRKMQSSIKAISDRLPRPFQLEADADSLPAPGWEEVMRDQLDLFFQDPMASETAKDGYLVLRANVHVTLAMTRLRLILHRENLIERSGPPGTPARSAAELVATDLGESVDWRHGVYQDLFKAVHGIPIQALAANGPSLVTKIRVVAVTLLDALPASDYGDSNVQGIAAYLLDFLNIMTSIESQFTD